MEEGRTSKGGRAEQWRKALPLGATMPLGHRGCNVICTLFSTTMALFPWIPEVNIFLSYLASLTASPQRCSPSYRDMHVAFNQRQPSPKTPSPHCLNCRLAQGQTQVEIVCTHIVLKGVVENLKGISVLWGH